MKAFAFAVIPHACKRLTLLLMVMAEQTKKRPIMDDWNGRMKGMKCYGGVAKLPTAL